MRYFRFWSLLHMSGLTPSPCFALAKSFIKYDYSLLSAKKERSVALSLCLHDFEMQRLPKKPQ